MSSRPTTHRWISGRARLLVLAGALARQKRVELTYRSRAGRRSVRLVDPLALKHVEGSWLLEGWCHALRKFQTFRVDFVERARVLRVRANPEGPVDLDHVRACSTPMYARPSDELTPRRATVQLEGPLIRHAAVLLPGALHEPGPDGALLCHLMAVDLGALGSLVCSLGKGASVIYPLQAREHLLVHQLISESRSP